MCSRRYYLQNKAKILNYNKQYHRKNPNKIREIKLKHDITRRHLSHTGKLNITKKKICITFD